MYEGIIVELPLAAFFLKKLRGVSSDLNDLPSLDRQLYGNLMKLTDPSLDLSVVGVHFTIIGTASGEDLEVPLMPGMQEITIHAIHIFTVHVARHEHEFRIIFMSLYRPTCTGAYLLHHTSCWCPCRAMLEIIDAASTVQEESMFL